MSGSSTRWVVGEEGSSLVEVALVLPMMLLLLVGSVDFGRGYYAAMEVSSAANAGACYGVQEPTDTTQGCGPLHLRMHRT